MRRLLIALVVLAALLVGADRVAEEIAEDRIAEQLVADLGTTPQVEVDGFPFLTQALRGRYDTIEVTGDTASSGGVRVEDFQADLEGVRVPLRDALGGRVSAVPVDRLQGSAVVTYDELARASRVPGLQLTPAGDQVRVTGPLQVLGQDLTVSALSRVSLEGDVLLLTAESFEVGGQPAPGVVSAALAGRLDLRVDVPPLPYDLELRDVRTTAEGVELSGTAQDVVLRR